MTTTAREHLVLSIEEAAERPCCGWTLIYVPRVRGAFAARPPSTRTHNLPTVAPMLDQVAGTSQDTPVTPPATRPYLDSPQVAGARRHPFGRAERPAQESADAPVSIRRHVQCLLA